MRPRGLYVVDPQRMYGGGFSLNSKLSTIHNCVNDKLIEKAKIIAKECELDKFAIIHINTNNIVRLLYKFE